MAPRPEALRLCRYRDCDHRRGRQQGRHDGDRLQRQGFGSRQGHHILHIIETVQLNGNSRRPFRLYLAA